MAILTAKGPALVHFFDFSQLNSVRTLPYITEWNRRYRDSGLSVIGVQAPRFGFGSDPASVATGLEQLGVEFPVMIDDQRAMWHMYGCEGWPSLFLWGRGGILQWFHFGEGDYKSTEEAIQECLADPGTAAFPKPMDPIRPTDADGIEVIAPGAELIPVEGRAWTIEDGRVFDVEYEAGGIHATASGKGTLVLAIDEVQIDPVGIDGPGLYTLAEHDRHGSHRIEIVLEGEPEIWSISFSPSVSSQPD